MTSQTSSLHAHSNAPSITSPSLLPTRLTSLLSYSTSMISPYSPHTGLSSSPSCNSPWCENNCLLSLGPWPQIPGACQCEPAAAAFECWGRRTRVLLVSSLCACSRRCPLSAPCTQGLVCCRGLLGFRSKGRRTHTHTHTHTHTGAARGEAEWTIRSAGLHGTSTATRSRPPRPRPPGARPRTSASQSINGDWDDTDDNKMCFSKPSEIVQRDMESAWVPCSAPIAVVFV